ncbi:membrane protein [Nocardia seriolae]|nr:membrane protein [Nocardia seriolae]
MKSWWQRMVGRSAATELDPARPDLVVVASSFDDTEACSAALGKALEWTTDAPVVLRHHLRIPADRVNEVQVIAAQIGYDTASADTTGPANLVLRRVQVLDALHCSQERSRIAAIAHRHDGDVLGWDALQPAKPGR